jgi:hypothetical protein
MTAIRVLLTLSRSAFSDLTVPRCVLAAFFNCLSDFFCRPKAARSLSSRRATARSTFCAAATLAAAGGVCADALRLALGLLELRVRLVGRALLDFFWLAGDLFEEVRRVAPRRVLVGVLLAMSVPVHRIVSGHLNVTICSGGVPLDDPINRPCARRSRHAGLSGTGGLLLGADGRRRGERLQSLDPRRTRPTRYAAAIVDIRGRSVLNSGCRSRI